MVQPFSPYFVTDGVNAPTVKQKQLEQAQARAPAVHRRPRARPTAGATP